MQNILDRILDNVILEKNYIQLDGIKYPRKENFFDLTAISNDNDVDKKKISVTFGKEWKKYNQILEEYSREFENYFDIVPIEFLETDILVADIGCGNGRWSLEFLKRNKHAFLVLIDISEAINIARENLRHYSDRVIFIKSDIMKLPIKYNSFDFLFSIGVIHHIPGKLINNLQYIVNFSDKSLIYLYYSLKNKNIIFRFIFFLVNPMRIVFSKITSNFLRIIITKIILYSVYMPIILFSKFLKKFNLNVSYIPLNYYTKIFCLRRIEQDVYDRFFTPIEKRISKEDIEKFSVINNFDISISNHPPFWHFFLSRNK